MHTQCSIHTFVCANKMDRLERGKNQTNNRQERAADERVQRCGIGTRGKHNLQFLEHFLYVCRDVIALSLFVVANMCVHSFFVRPSSISVAIMLALSFTLNAQAFAVCTRCTHSGHTMPCSIISCTHKNSLPLYVLYYFLFTHTKSGYNITITGNDNFQWQQKKNSKMFFSIPARPF